MALLILTCDMTHTCVTWLIVTCITAASYSHEPWRFLMWRDITHSNVTWLIVTCITADYHSHEPWRILTWQDSNMTWLILTWHDSFLCDMTHCHVRNCRVFIDHVRVCMCVWHDSWMTWPVLSNVTWLILMCLGGWLRVCVCGVYACWLHVCARVYVWVWD